MRVSSIAILVLSASSAAAFAPFGVNKISRHHVLTLQSSPAPENEADTAASLEMRDIAPIAEESAHTAPKPPEVKPAEPPKPAAKIGHPSDFDRIRSTMNSSTPEKKPLQMTPPKEGRIMFRDFLERRAAPSPPSNPPSSEGVMFSDSLNRKPGGTSATKPNADKPNRKPVVAAKPDFDQQATDKAVADKHFDQQATDKAAAEKPKSTDAGLYSFPSNEREGSFGLQSNNQGGEGGVNFSGYLDAGMGRGYDKRKWINGNTR